MTGTRKAPPFSRRRGFCDSRGVRIRPAGAATRSACRPTEPCRTGYLFKRPVGRPPHEVRRFYAGCSYQAQSWNKPRRVVAKIEWRPGELYPRVGLIVTNLVPRAARVAFYKHRGTAEQWDQGGQRRDQMNPAVVPHLCGQRTRRESDGCRLCSHRTLLKLSARDELAISDLNKYYKRQAALSHWPRS